jgi:ABC-type uncharacterized transport system permease subunit
MNEGISILCFFATYSVTLALEINRAVFGTGRRMAYITFATGMLGLVAQAWFLTDQVHKGLLRHTAPLSSFHHWFLIAAFVLVAVYLVWSFRRPGTAFGLFLLPVSLLLILLATRFPPEQTFSPQRASLVWGTIHGGSLLLGTVAVCVGFAAGLMYLFQSYGLKHKTRARRGFRLPSLESLQQTNSRALVISSVLLGIGLLAGVLLNLTEPEEGLSWADPAVLSSGGLFLWLVVACLFSMFYKPVRVGKKVAYLTVASFIFLMLVLGITLLGPSTHGGGTRKVDAAEADVPHDRYAITRLFNSFIRYGDDSGEVAA